MTFQKDNSVAVYIHWPFCVSKCPYCDFNSHVRERVDYAAFSAAYMAELSYYMPVIQARGVKSVFFGGGTPSLMPPELTMQLLERLQPYYQKNTEVTLEANPSSSERMKLRAFKDAGINRLSIGVQSFRDDALSFLGRAHNGRLAASTLETASALFGNRFSFDMIYALPGMSYRRWKTDMRTVLDVGAQHLSLYQLTIERGTPFYSAHKDGKFSVPNDDRAAYFHDMTADITASAGYTNYEISNYAQSGAASVHNLQYWRYGDYLGIGPGAHGRYTDPISEKRLGTITIHHPERWVNQVAARGNGIQKEEIILSKTALSEALLAGLRLREGICKARLSAITGVSYDEMIPPEKEHALIAEGLLTDSTTVLRCTRKGLLKHQGIIAYLTEKTA